MPDMPLAAARKPGTSGTAPRAHPPEEHAADDRALSHRRTAHDARRHTRFRRREVTPFIRKNWQLEWDMKPENRPSVELLEGGHKIGVRTLGVPEEFGGTPLDPKTEVQTYAMIAEEIARGDSGLADKLVQIWKISLLLRNIAPRHLQERWFPRIVEDPSFLLAHALTEPRGASDRWLPYDVPEAMMHTRAELKGDKWVINGRKQFITNGYDAKLYVVYATTKPGAGITKGTSSFPRAARHARSHGRALQRDGGRALHEQRRDRVRGLRGAEGPLPRRRTRR